MYPHDGLLLHCCYRVVVKKLLDAEEKRGERGEGTLPAGFHQGSHKMTCEAQVIFKPTPPAFSEHSNTKGESDPLDLNLFRTSCLCNCDMDPSRRVAFERRKKVKERES